jgi:hypothetical protein
MLLPEDVLSDALTRAKLEAALETATDRLLVYQPGAALPEIRCARNESKGTGERVAKLEAALETAQTDCWFTKPGAALPEIGGARRDNQGGRVEEGGRVDACNRNEIGALETNSDRLLVYQPGAALAEIRCMRES